MALKKYRFIIGICGPTVLKSHIIRAEDERTAAQYYLLEIGKELTEENITEQLRYIREIIPKDDPDKILDYFGQEIAIGNAVMFIRNQYGKTPILLSGKVDKISGKSIVIITQSGESYRIILSEYEEKSLSRVIVMRSRPERTGDEALDASGYTVEIGDPVVYMKPSVHNRCDGFISGIVTKLTAKNAEINDTKRSLARLLVTNW